MNTKRYAGFAEEGTAMSAAQRKDVERQIEKNQAAE